MTTSTRPEHTVAITEADTIPGFYAARACLSTRNWHQVLCGVTDMKSELARELAKEGARIIPADMDNPNSIKHLVGNADALVMVPPRDFDAADKLKKVLDALEDMQVPLVAAAAESTQQQQQQQGGDHDKLRAMVFVSCILAAMHGAAAEGAESRDHKNVVQQWLAMEKEVKHRCKKATICRVGFPMQSMFALSEIIQNKGVMPLNFGNGEVAPVNLKDAMMGLAKVAHESVMHGRPGGKAAAAHHGQLYTLTGTQLLTAAQLASTATHVLEAPVTYRGIDDHEMRRILEATSGLHRYDVEEFLTAAKCIRMGKMAIRTQDLERLLHRQPSTIDRFWQENKNMFKPRGGRIIQAVTKDY
ncbi:hypothetical protein AMAG_07372 [Allomyces macrogynus ATCC 38327]|uniref:Uncharacterized protein n=1 Tax=Allomyces macrogynus (strain ATCC 38327) TaxID=578462 RepID=A0A0L0SHY9_ALLM3|nr:hypothetical protein AMAG_07372 [Allomyces macrogynus ATCC 38327]|eukprot:KNE62126.1 hypothetical protein AMAG_07372 [Allomyces macrogynus ATCC 38327]